MSHAVWAGGAATLLILIIFEGRRLANRWLASKESRKHG